MKNKLLLEDRSPLFYEEGDDVTYKIDIPLDVDLDSLFVSSWTDLSYFSGENGFTPGEECTWEDSRTIRIEVKIARRTARAINTDLKAAIDAMIDDVVRDMKRRPCKAPCDYKDPEVTRTSKSIVWGRCSELITDPNANPPYGLPPYRHYICLQYLATYKITLKCAE